MYIKLQNLLFICRSDSVKEMYVQKEELDTMVISLEQKLNTFEKVEKGKVPDPPEVAPVPITVKDPEVQTVEVCNVLLDQLFLCVNFSTLTF